jgi:membrane associated rhomboid family serine protease
MRYPRYRTTGFSSYFPKGVKWLLIVNCAVFVVQFFAGVLLGVDPFRGFGLSPIDVLERFRVWQLFTYMFIHGGIFHLVINMLILWMFGMDLERDWGTRRFLQYYFLCGVGAGLCVVALGLALGGISMVAHTIGASGAIFGLLLAFGVLYPDRIVLMFFLFPMKAKYFVMIMGAIEFFYTFQPNTGISNIAHLGGMLFGYIFLKTRLLRVRFSPVDYARGQYREWKLQRARRKFQVYMRKHKPDRDEWLN